MMKTIIVPDRNALTRAAADFFAAEAQAALQAKGRFAVALSGGSTPTATFTPTATPTPTATASPTPPPASTTQGISIGSVWARVQPGETGEITGLLLPNTPVEIHAAQGAWLEVSWEDSEGEHRGWVPAQWIQTAFLTPTP